MCRVTMGGVTPPPNGTLEILLKTGIQWGRGNIYCMSNDRVIPVMWYLLTHSDKKVDVSCDLHSN